ncbi:MAG: hypothetical protein ACRCU3_09150 [Eubacteriaceae bacterium]
MEGKEILLRASYDIAKKAIDLLVQSGASVIENEEDIERIENWEKLYLTKRKIMSITAKEIFNISSNPEMFDFIKSQRKVFVKSRKKGFTLIVSTEKLLRQDQEVHKILDSIFKKSSKKLLISKAYDITEDSLGKKEARFFVIDGKIVNASRMVHSVKHSVPNSLVVAADKAVKTIDNSKFLFPSNYVLDIAEFRTENDRFTDIVEINPLTSSLCYINNSIYNVKIPEIEAIYNVLGAGYEYCYDALANRNRYVINRCAGEKYEYENPEHYVLL